MKSNISLEIKPKPALEIVFDKRAKFPLRRAKEPQRKLEACGPHLISLNSFR